MKNLNISIEKATKPNPVKSVNRKFLYGLCAALFLLICSLSTKAANYRSLNGYGYGFYYGFFGSGSSSSDLYVEPFTLGFSSPNSTSEYDTFCTSCSPFTNNYGDANHSGNDVWIQFNIADDGYLHLSGGTSSFDSVFYLFDSNWNLVASGDDGAGSGAQGCNAPPYLSYDYLQPDIYYYASAGTYYLIVDGTDKNPCVAKSGDIEVLYGLSH